MILLENITYQKAVYSEQIIREYQGNPLIEALPEIIESPQEFIKRTTYIPEIRKEDRSLSVTYRAHMLDSIRDFFKPLSYHIEIEQTISRMIRCGYINRNPYRSRLIKNDLEGFKYGITQTDSSTVAELGIFGISGMGKSTLINKILSLYPQLILHTNYNGDRTIRYQIPWIKVETPAGCRIKSLSLNILNAIDNLFGEENYYKKGNDKKEYEQIQYLKYIFDIHSVGLLIIDEIQNIRGIASKESEKVMRFFVELSNVINVPIVLIGTLKALPLFTTEMKNCRRIADSRPMYKSQNNREWKAFVKTLFLLQWTQYPVEASEELINTLYEESQGVTDIAIKLFKLSQLRAMYTGEERITKNIIKSVASDSLIPLKPLLLALKSNKEKLLMQYEDLYDTSNYFNTYIKQEKAKVNTHERYMAQEYTSEDMGNVEFNIIEGITSFLIQAGFDLKLCKRTAKETIKKYGADIDINLLKRYAYEKLLFKNKENDIDTKSTHKDKAILRDELKGKTPKCGMLKAYNENISTDKNEIYENLKNLDYIASTEELSE